MEKHFLKTALTTAAFLSVSVGAWAEEILLEGFRPKLTIHSDERLKGGVKREFGYFKKNADFYGALYVNLQEDIAAEFWNAPNMAMAKQSAKKSCVLKSQDPSLCKLYATVGPKHPATGEGITLSQTGNRYFKKYQQSQKAGKYGAFATSGYGAPGYSWGYASEIEAKTSAIRACESKVEQMNSDTSAHIVRNVIEAEDLTCRVIHVTKS
ncbi:DUF4189 domain-containing protein [Leisingera aquaemixtae]|uniref:DUF4189 domain-containing protein n=1 Tax=Leisingera aquaemixtae TaxID=1396826 RepID=UPI001C98E0B3|nr:DUF4189 domain-containing protein [Leisingera aquaemixtae]MBY6067547.1 DUF4189 domain-containing protein [Leisingera aquaemixtae]